MSYIYMEHLFLMFLDHAQRRSTVGRAPLDEWSARRRDLYLATHDTHNRQISMPPVGFELTISAGERPCRSPAEILGSNPTWGMDIRAIECDCTDQNCWNTHVNKLTTLSKSFREFLKQTSDYHSAYYFKFLWNRFTSFCTCWYLSVFSLSRLLAITDMTEISKSRTEIFVL